MSRFDKLIYLNFLLSCLAIIAPTLAHGLDEALGKVMICGVCRNIEAAVENSVCNIELLGRQFDDYVVIIYENNSTDNTATLLSKWAETNTHVVFISETLPAHQIPASREQGIARARNIVLSVAKQEQYETFEHLIMVDLDFLAPWPVAEIVASTQTSGEWDCISANGVFEHGTLYWDRYAFRDKNYPFGPEVLGRQWWSDLRKSWFGIDSEELIPVYSGFGGLAIYKRATIIHFTYSGTVTEDLQRYYGNIMNEVGPNNIDVLRYFKLNKLKKRENLLTDLIIFQSKPRSNKLKGFRGLICCEHVTLHASMAMAGYNKFFINPKMVMSYPEPLPMPVPMPQKIN